MSKSSLPADKYFAAVDREELPGVLRAKAQAFREKLDNDGRTDVMRRSERAYYGYDGSGGMKNSVAVTFAGDEGEQVTARINHFRSIAQALIAMVTGQRPAWKARAINTDVQSLQQTSLAEGVVDWVYRSKSLEDLRIEQVERAVISGEGYVHLRWDPYVGREIAKKPRPVYDEQGEPVMEEIQVTVAEGGLEGGVDAATLTEQRPKTEEWPVREGDIAPAVLGPLEVVRDINARDARWCAAPHRESVWDLAARFPQMRGDIVALRGQDQWPRRIWCDTTLETPDEDDDTVTVWCFYHLPCDALPHGRYAVIVGDIVLYDEAWPFGDEIPVYQLLPMREMGSAQGHTPMWDLLCLQELYDACFTSLANATEGRGEGNVLAPKGSDVDVTMLARGYQLIEWNPSEGLSDGGRPTALTGLFDVPSDAYRIEEILKRTMETLSGVNSVTRGDPQSQLKSGAALALVQSLTQHFNSALQAGVTRNDERVGTGILKLYQRFSPRPRLAEIIGQHGATALKEFTSENLSAIQRVTVEMGNPAMRGPGLVEMAMELLKANIITDTTRFFELINTGRIEPLFAQDLDEQRLIQRENEMLGSGQPVEVAPTDRDDIHVRHHARVLDEPDARQNPAIVNAVMTHITEHMLALGDPRDPTRSKSVEMMWAIGQELPPWRSPGGPGEGGPPGGPGGPGGGGDGPPAERAKPLGAEPEAGGPPMPLMPQNPATGERVPAGPQGAM